LIQDRFSDLEALFDTTNKERLSMVAWKDQSLRAVVRLRSRKTKLQEEDVRLSKVAELLGNIQREADSQGHKALEKVVNRALDMVFGGEHKFILHQEQKRNVTVTTPCLEERGKLLPIYDSRGGGLEDVVAFVLQMLAVLRSNPPLRRIILVDEPFSHLAAAQTPAMADMLRELVDQFGLTVLLVSHNPEFRRVSNRSYEVYRSEPGKTSFKETTED